MSWNASLTDDRGHNEGSWNYTHNTNAMIELAATGNIEIVMGSDVGWWRHLHGKSGAEGKALLDRIITGLESEPDRFRAMNPPNGWGDYDGLLRVLREMREAVPSWPTTWRVHG